MLHAAASDRLGHLSISGTDNGRVCRDLPHATHVEAVTGDGLWEEHGPFTVLKVDVEGYEETVLQGCAGLLASRPRLAIEIHDVPEGLPAYGGAVERILGLIDAEAYEGTVVVRPRIRESAPFSLASVPRGAIFNLFLRPRA